MSSEISPPLSGDGTATDKKKSILLNPEYKRGSSKATIQWEEGVKGQRSLEERLKLERRNRLHAFGYFMSHGSKWSYIQEFMTTLKFEGGKYCKSIPISEEDSQDRSYPRTIDSLIRELCHGMLQMTVIKGDDLTLDQQTKLEILKQKKKLENDKYLKGQPELDILLSLVYRKLLRTKPDDPKMFVANYVHYLNTHREELVLDEVDVPFDVAPVEDEEPVEGEDVVDERQKVEIFVRALVQKCAEMASCGSAVVNVTNIIDSLLENIDSPIDVSSSSSLRSAERAAKGILMSMLTSVARARTKSAEIVAEEILDSIFENVCPGASRDEIKDFVEMRESVESFVRSLLKNLTDKVSRRVKRQDRLNKLEKNFSTEESSLSEDILSITSKSILKKRTPSVLVVELENNNTKPLDKPTKVKFQSVSLRKSNSSIDSTEGNLHD